MKTIKDHIENSTVVLVKAILYQLLGPKHVRVQQIRTKLPPNLKLTTNTSVRPDETRATKITHSLMSDDELLFWVTEFWEACHAVIAHYNSRSYNPRGQSFNGSLKGLEVNTRRIQRKSWLWINKTNKCFLSASSMLEEVIFWLSFKVK